MPKLTFSMIRVRLSKKTDEQLERILDAFYIQFPSKANPPQHFDSHKSKVRWILSAKPQDKLMTFLERTT